MKELYNKLMEENLRIMKDSNNYTVNKEINVLDVLMFKISSLTMSLLINEDKSPYISLTERFVLRNLIEELSLFKYISDGNEYDKDLFKHLIFEKEYNIYKEIKNDLANIDLMKKNKDSAKKYLKGKLKINTEKYEVLIKKRIPFIKDMESYHELINTVLGEKYSDWYKKLSASTHFSLNTQEELINNESRIIKSDILFIMAGLFNKEVIPKSDYFNNKKISSPAIDALRKYVDAELKLIFEISKYFSEQKPLVTYLINEYYFLNDDLFEDYKFDLNEMINIKIKPIYELFSLLDIYLNDRNLLFSDELIYLHEIMIKQDTNKSKLNTEKLYLKYLEESKDIVDYDLFYKRFNNQFGIIKSEELKSYNQIKNHYVLNNSDFNKRFDHLGFFDESENIVNMFYQESLLLSHANGTLFFVNDGLFSDSSFYKLLPYLFLNILIKYNEREKNKELEELLSQYTNLAQNKTKLLITMESLPWRKK